MPKPSVHLLVLIFGVWILASKGSTALGEDSPNHTFSKSNFFNVQSFAGGPSSQKVLDLCDSLRTELVRVWSGKVGPPTWEPRCEVIIHGSRAEYSKAVGPGSDSTNGSSIVQLQSGDIASRRIDLIVDKHGVLSALPHELTHVILSDCLAGRQPPLWLDEGIAMLSDTHEKQLLHERDCIDAISSKNELSIDALVRLNQFSSSNQVAPFYGQSLTLVRMLALQKSPETLIKFAKDSMDNGIAVALKRHYQINDVGELERLWRLELLALKSSTKRKPFVSVRFQP